MYLRNISFITTSAKIPTIENTQTPKQIYAGHTNQLEVPGLTQESNQGLQAR